VQTAARKTAGGKDLDLDEVAGVLVGQENFAAHVAGKFVHCQDL
jgi:hypothetical protein